MGESDPMKLQTAEEQKQFTVKDATIQLNSTPCPIHIKRRRDHVPQIRPAYYRIEIAGSGDVQTNLSIDIGSSIEVMNKKTSDLLFVIAVISLALAVFAEFRRHLTWA